jgi:Fic family protein
MHKRLLQNVRGESKGPGTIRTIQNWIGKSGSSLIDANYVPPAPEEVPVLMENLVSYLQAEDKTNPLVKIGLAHYQFETIHPFRDGNGRVGRLLIILYLLKTKVIPYPLLYLSAYFESRRQTYYDLLLAVSKNGKYEDWLKFFLRGVIHQSEDAVSRTRRLSDYIRACKEKTKKNRNAGNLSVVLDHLFSNPYVTVRSISEVMGKSYPTAEHTIADLVEMGILAEITGQKRSRMFLAKEIIKIIQEDPTLNPKPETKALTDR